MFNEKMDLSKSTHFSGSFALLLCVDLSVKNIQLSDDKIPAMIFLEKLNQLLWKDGLSHKIDTLSEKNPGYTPQFEWLNQSNDEHSITLQLRARTNIKGGKSQQQLQADQNSILDWLFENTQADLQKAIETAPIPFSLGTIEMSVWFAVAPHMGEKIPAEELWSIIPLLGLTKSCKTHDCTNASPSPS